MQRALGQELRAHSTLLHIGLGLSWRDGLEGISLSGTFIASYSIMNGSEGMDSFKREEKGRHGTEAKFHIGGCRRI